MTNISVNQELLGNGPNLGVVRPRAAGYPLLSEGLQTLQAGIALGCSEPVVEISLIENLPRKAFFNEKLDFQFFFSGFHQNFDILFHSWKDLEENSTCHLVFFFSVKLNLVFIFSVTFLALEFSVKSFFHYWGKSEFSHLLQQHQDFAFDVLLQEIILARTLNVPQSWSTSNLYFKKVPGNSRPLSLTLIPSKTSWLTPNLINKELEGKIQLMTASSKEYKSCHINILSSWQDCISAPEGNWDSAVYLDFCRAFCSAQLLSGLVRWFLLLGVLNPDSSVDPWVSCSHQPSVCANDPSQGGK